MEALKNHPTAFAADRARDRETDWQTRIANPKGAIFLAYSGGSPVSMAGILRGFSSKTRHSARIWGVYISPAYRRKGVGKLLLETALDWGKQMGVRIAKLGMTAGNQEALGLYTALGFQVYGNEPQALFVNGQAYDELLLAKGI
jgi:GNAT superfamily N-acetyltransferase